MLIFQIQNYFKQKKKKKKEDFFLKKILLEEHVGKFKKSIVF